MSLSIINRAREMKRQLERRVRKISVPGLGENGNALIITVQPVTNGELQEIWRGRDVVERAARTIDVRARNEAGERLFGNEADDIIAAFPPKLIIGIAEKINRDLEGLYQSSGVEEVDGGLDYDGENVAAAGK